MKQISTVIIKPTKACNAQCTYCSSPPFVNEAQNWSLDQFKRYFDKFAPYITDTAMLLWHGGEPMLMGPDFYWKAWEYVQAEKPNVSFSMQTNLLSYGPRWKDLLQGPFRYSVSTSWDPDGKDRHFKGSAKLYSAVFWRRMEAFLEDGFHPKILATFTSETMKDAHTLYDKALQYGDRTFDIRINYRFPVGLDHGKGVLITPREYGETLVKILDRWLDEEPAFNVTPLDQMIRASMGEEAERCPWTSVCGGKFLGIEPNGDVYNCPDFADLEDPQYRFGNLETDDMATMLASPAARQIRRRRIQLPSSCYECPYFHRCQGGCARDTVAYQRDLSGKFFYCESWKMVYAAIDKAVSESRGASTFKRLQNYYAKPAAKVKAA
ncbi:radical SAM protein [Pseudovibrio ascidiaceicola]|uniref:radical SAM protein n=1 Tax=Pseudovibrio ascidiaceicola TaxID=285279 RepID=UPI003D35A079